MYPVYNGSLQLHGHKIPLPCVLEYCNVDKNLILLFINELATRVKNTFSLKDYFIDRYFRLSVVAIPAIVLTFVLDQFAFNFFHKDLLYLQRCEDWLDSSSYTLQTFFGNIFYLQTLFYNSFVLMDHYGR